MSTHTIDQATRPEARHPMNVALLRMAATAALSVLFALIDCAAPADLGQGLVAAAVNDPPPSVAQAATTNTPADSLDLRVGADAHTRRN